MKLFSTSILSMVLLLATSCSLSNGTKVKEPFSGKKYTSNARYFRAVGKGVSSRDNVAESKAEIEAHKDLAQQVSTTIKVVTDAYAQDVQGEHVDQAVERFETLAREITNTSIGDLRQIGNVKYQLKDGNYSVYLAYEIKKKAMFKFLKMKAKADSKISSMARTQIINMCDKEIERLDSLE
ncbi:MAG: hypothetical protein CL847_02555 [Crocinitomicaceae bacterium]|nr:hypothetical protein [Crocinitomicaceae bacterium]|tara:strand:- start:7244 stop:7786 length:543 start_codon:yes stop_codon:yes gene_type:complete